MTVTRFSRVAALFTATAMIAGASIPAQAAVRDPANGKTETTKPKSDSKVDKKRYCVEMDGVVGTRVRQRICKTREEWIDQEGFDPIRLPRK